YVVTKDAPHEEAAYAFINYLLDPYIQTREFASHGYASGDSRVDAMLPAETAENSILFPAAELLNGLEFGAAQTMTDPLRAELMARFKAA
ncbi:MAG: spermidine/putrescine ABC transporter substrate-binding protein, partial [Rhodospirillales bacterium]|nr:spermidine/putrescine ABC transporter substrate-binding protein [Rhodospirillales bacterium]